MAEISVDGPALAIVEEVDLTLDATAADVAGEDFDFDLGGGAELERDDGDGPTSNLTKIEIGADLDEINYEEDTGHDDVPAQNTTAEADNGHANQENDAPAHDEGADEIDYEDTDVHVTTTTHDDHDAAQARDIDASEQHEAGHEHNDIDFGFEDAGDSHTGEEEHGENDENDRGEYDQEEDGSHQHDEDGEDRDMAESKKEDDEDEDEEENDENRAQHVEVDNDDSDGSGHYDVDDDDEEDSDSDSGLSALQSFYPVSTFDVVVTWGDQVCPLFKTPGVEDPDSFYLDDYEAMNYPLSKFLQTIRSSISSWVRASDEILIQVDELGLEFGETTTEALLSQVTFHNLLALHNTLVKNDDSDKTKGVHITLSTRSNCLLRLKDLVGGAGSGKGLSEFPSATSRVDESSDDSGEAEAESDDSSPDGEVDEMVDEDDDEEIEDDIEEDAEDDGVDVDMAGSLDDESVASQGFAEAVINEAGRSELDTPTADEDADEDADAVEETDYINYTNEEVDDDVDGVHLGPDGVADPPTPHADVGDEFEFANAEDNLIDGLASDEAELNQVDDLDLLEDINDAGDIVSHGQEGGAVETAGQEDHQQEENHEDDFLDLSGDIDDTAASAATLEAGNKADDLELSLDTSATATLDNDEIDYEDSRPNGEKTEATLDTGADEIDWDVEIKNAAPPADPAATSPTASGKRTREVDESGDALLDDLPDLKRHRTGNTPS